MAGVGGGWRGAELQRGRREKLGSALLGAGLHVLAEEGGTGEHHSKHEKLESVRVARMDGWKLESTLERDKRVRPDGSRQQKQKRILARRSFKIACGHPTNHGPDLVKVTPIRIMPSPAFSSSPNSPPNRQSARNGERGWPSSTRYWQARSSREVRRVIGGPPWPSQCGQNTCPRRARDPSAWSPCTPSYFHMCL